MTSAYCDRDDVEMVFGATNVEKWADVDNDEDATKIADRIDWAIEEASERIDTRMRGGLYEVPFSVPYPRTIVTLVARLAGITLYDARGITDPETPDALTPHRDLVEKGIGELLSGKARLDLTPATRQYPTVVDLEGGS